MISSNDLSIFTLHHNLNGIFDNSLCLIQDIMCTSDPASEKFKRVCKDVPNLEILTKSVTTGEVQLTFTRTSVGNKSLGEPVTAFALTESLEALAVISIDADIAFANSGDKTRLPVTELLLRAAVGNLARPKKQRIWVAINAVILPPFLT